MGVKLEDLMAELSPQDLRDVNARTRKHVKAIEEASRLDAVRKALGRTQQEVAAHGRPQSLPARGKSPQGRLDRSLELRASPKAVPARPKQAGAATRRAPRKIDPF